MKELENTLQQFRDVVSRCKEVFIAKHKDYGPSWTVLRPSSLTDQILIKAWRIRNVEEAGTQKVEDSAEQDFIGIVNYGVMALMALAHPEPDTGIELISSLYDEKIEEIRHLMMQKNHDYGEVWRKMRVSSYTDLILMKLLRIKQIEENQGSTLISEGVDANYMDIVNYAIFALIKMQELHSAKQV